MSSEFINALQLCREPRNILGLKCLLAVLFEHAARRDGIRWVHIDEVPALHSCEGTFKIPRHELGVGEHSRAFEKFVPRKVRRELAAEWHVELTGNICAVDAIEAIVVKVDEPQCARFFVEVFRVFRTPPVVRVTVARDVHQPAMDAFRR